MQPLPIDAHLPAIVAAVRARRSCVVVAPPGAGKTTRVPPALLGDGPLILLQPRRVAARALARRIAEEQGFTLGEEIGWQVRFERRFSARTRLLVATEGILTARLQADPLLSDFRTVVLDEFHERSLHADLALALARQALRARDDLRLLVMSATLDARAVSAFLDDCPVVEAPGRLHAVEVEHAPGLSPADGARRALATSDGHVLVFLPGQAEIRRACSDLAGGAARVFPLHGSLTAEEQDAALRPSREIKVIVATNVAETSLTVDGVTAVVDSGQQRVPRYDPATGLDRLVLERVARDSAEQRAGRAGRSAPGRCLRLWDAREILRPRREPEIERVDLCAPLLEILAWGGDPLAFEWFEAPPSEAVEAALELLARLGALSPARRLTALGARLQRLPLHPRLGRVLLEARGSRRAAAACALLSERLPASNGTPVSTDCDLFPLLDRLRELGPGVLQAARELQAASEAHERQVQEVGGREPPVAERRPIHSGVAEVRGFGGREPPVAERRPIHSGVAEVRGFGGREPPAPERRRIHSGVAEVRGFGGREPPAPERRRIHSGVADDDDVRLRRALLCGYPDRVAQRREPGSARLLLTSGTGARLGRESGVTEGEFLLALDVSAGAPGDGSEALVRAACRVEPEWLVPTRRELRHVYDGGAQAVRAGEREFYGALCLREHPRAPDPTEAARLLRDALVARGLDDAAQGVLRRLRFAGLEVDIDALLLAACEGRRTLPEVELPALLPGDVRRQLDALAPDSLEVPSGRRARLEYRADGSVVAAVKLQELFGLADTPRLGPRLEAVVFELLAPNGRPVQTTRDLRGFWERTYADVRKELRGRYPRHPWPEDPWTAPATARTKKRAP